jgi:hypothetical protein
MTRALIVARAGRPFQFDDDPIFDWTCAANRAPAQVDQYYLARLGKWIKRVQTDERDRKLAGNSRTAPRAGCFERRTDREIFQSTSLQNSRLAHLRLFPRFAIRNSSSQVAFNPTGLSLQGFAPRWNTPLQAIGPLEAPLLSIGLSHPVRVSGRMLCRSSAVPLIACDTEVGALQGFVPRRKRASGKSVGKTAILRATQASLRRSDRRRDRPVD